MPLAQLPVPGVSSPFGLQLQFFDALACLAALLAAVQFLRAPQRGRLTLLLYPAVLMVSAAFSDRPSMSIGPLLRGLYLAGLGCSVGVLLTATPEGRRWLCRGWLGGLGLVALATLIGVAGFYLGYDTPQSNPFLFHYGTLTSGPYPRICATFFNANLLCNYLVVTLGWLYALPMQALLLLAGFTLSPGLGPLALGFLWLRGKKWSKMLGVLAALLVYLVSWVYPGEALQGHFRHSSRVDCWWQAGLLWLERPFLGQGPGQADLKVVWVDSQGQVGNLDDPHSLVLSLLSQGGLLTLLVFAALTLRPAAESDRQLALAVGLAIWVDGLTGSFEDARHLWLALGVLEAGRSAAGIRLRQLSASPARQSPMPGPPAEL